MTENTTKDVTSKLITEYELSYDDIMNLEPIDFANLVVKKPSRKDKNLIEREDAESFADAAIHDLKIAYEKIESLEAEINALRLEHQELSDEHDSDQTLLKQYDKLDTKGEQMESVLSELEQMISTLSMEHEQDKARIQELETQLANSDNIDNLRDQLSSVTIERDSLKSQLSVSQQELDSTRASVEDLARDVNEALNSFATFIEELN